MTRNISVRKKSLRITILGINYSPEPSGNAPYTTSLAEGLAKAGHQVTVLTGYPHYPDWSRKGGYTGWKMSEELNGVTVHRLRHFIPTNPTPIARLLMELSFGVRLLAARWHRPDVVLVVSPALLASALAIFRARIIPNRPAVAIWIQDLYSRGVIETNTGGDGLAKLASSIESKILKSVDGVAAIHERFKQHIVDSLNVKPPKVEVIRNWTHLPAAPTEGIPEMRMRLGWDENEIIVLHAGNMGKKQGLENVITAARLASERECRVRFVLMGGGNQRERLEGMAQDVPNVSFIDSLPHEEFQLALAAANVLLVNELPGLKDMAVPSKLTSYFNSGVPVLAATDKGSVTAFEIGNCNGGIRVDPADPAALLDAIEALEREPAEAKRLATNALRFRTETLSEEAAVAHYDEFITSLASSRGL